MENIGAFIKSNYDLVGAPVLALILLVLEKLMETEFICPSDKVFGIIYSLVFIFGTTLILIMLVNPCQCCVSGDVEHGPAGRIAIHDESQSCKQRCCRILQTIGNGVRRYKAPIFWFLILITDGRYWKCLVESAQGLKKTTTNTMIEKTTVNKDFLLQIIQMIGLGLILLFVIVVQIKFEPKSKRYENKHKDTILEYTHKALQERKKQKLKNFVNQNMGPDNWDPKYLNSEEEWEKITENLRSNVVGNLQSGKNHKNPDISLDVFPSQNLE